MDRKEEDQGVSQSQPVSGSVPLPVGEAVGSGALAPCPFCGGPAISSYCRDGRVITCQACLASAAPAFQGPADRPSAEQRAQANWNRRAAPNPPRSHEALEAARWRALLTCPRIRMYGSAGVDPKTGERNEGTHVHFGADFWSMGAGEDEDGQSGGASTAWGRFCLTALADARLEIEAAQSSSRDASVLAAKPTEGNPAPDEPLQSATPLLVEALEQARIVILDHVPVSAMGEPAEGEPWPVAELIMRINTALSAARGEK